jgi:hypothetical protein
MCGNFCFDTFETCSPDGKRLQSWDLLPIFSAEEQLDAAARSPQTALARARESLKVLQKE